MLDIQNARIYNHRFGIQWSFDSSIVPETGTVNILVSSSSTGTGLDGVYLGLYSHDNLLLGKYRTDLDGRILISQLLPGEYTIRQLADYGSYPPFADRIFSITAGVETSVSIVLQSTDITTRWMDLYNHLQARDFEVYPPASKRGECLSPYVVPIQEQSTEYYGYSSQIDYYAVLCYIPLDTYVEVNRFVNRVKLAMKAMYPMFRETGNITQPYLDSDIRAWMVSIEYVNYRKVNLFS